MKSQASSLISIVTCFYNEEAVVDAFFAATIPILESINGCNFEIVCVDDGSTDDTLQKLLTHQARDTRLRIIELSRNFGKESALTAGIEHAQGDAIIPIDADLQDPPELIPKMVDIWHQGIEVVLAKRKDRSSDSYFKKKTAELFYRINNRLSSTNLPENVGDFRLMDRVVIDALKQFPERQRFMKGLFAWVGFRSSVIEYMRKPRHAGTGKFSAWGLWNLALEGITSFTSLPLRIWTYIGLSGAFAALVYAGFIIFLALRQGIDVPGYASLLVVILLMGSMHFISIGLLGEYIGRIYIESKQRPIYLIRKIHQQKTDES
jgi:glycosyltransferase involved in cell wall biosynthesis